MFWYLQYGTTTHDGIDKCDLVGCDTIRNAPLFISRPSYCDLDWLMPSIQIFQSDHESQVQPPVHPEEQDHTPELQPQPQGTNDEPSQPSQQKAMH
ncbi:hypothetical protein BPOR_0382g00110 [Botrytis porri]|uniref:Uncharacterized protein n=1 Tax=Botrytis porri TaxID=87229 RepID=A0A4Z1KSD8_9HELO|nr:hypothetical protein BPOR_0382g00110 [Botrytis porri]